MNDKHECQHLVASLSEYIDGALSPELCAELERHLQDCQNCRIVVDTLKKTIELYQAPDEGETLPDDVRARLYYRLHLEDYLK